MKKRNVVTAILLVAMMVIMNFTTVTLVSADDEINFASESNLAYQKSVVVQSGNKASAFPPENFTDGKIESQIYFNPVNKGHNVRVLVNLGDVYDLTKVSVFTPSNRSISALYLSSDATADEADKVSFTTGYYTAGGVQYGVATADSQTVEAAFVILEFVNSNFNYGYQINELYVEGTSAGSGAKDFTSSANIAYGKPAVNVSGLTSGGGKVTNIVDGDLATQIYYNPVNGGHNDEFRVDLGQVYVLSNVSVYLNTSRNLHSIYLSDDNVADETDKVEFTENDELVNGGIMRVATVSDPNAEGRYIIIKYQNANYNYAYFLNEIWAEGTPRIKSDRNLAKGISSSSVKYTSGSFYSSGPVEKMVDGDLTTCSIRGGNAANSDFCLTIDLGGYYNVTEFKLYTTKDVNWPNKTNVYMSETSTFTESDLIESSVENNIGDTYTGSGYLPVKALSTSMSNQKVKTRYINVKFTGLTYDLPVFDFFVGGSEWVDGANNDFSVSDNVVSVYNITKNADLIVAAYNGNKLISVDKFDITKDCKINIADSIAKEATSAKVMLWNESSVVPLCKAK